VTLLGQNVNSYGNDLTTGYYFADLLKDLNKIEKLKRIRFMTSHPKDLTDEVIDAIASCDKVCPAIHLAIQSGSTRVLKVMNRRYTKEQIINLVEKVRTRIPGVAITTDIIIGFPGETEEDFQDTLDVIKTCKFDSAFSFIYSIRTGTPAATMENQIPDEVKHHRFNRLLDVLRDISYSLNSGYQDKVLPVLVEEVSKNNPDRLTGRTESGKIVNIQTSQENIGKIINVKITNVKSFSLTGEEV
ncbi:MAG: MiaB/RimO family radical SAM methylthiotransferase, partial [Eubacterium sp.]